VSSIFFIFLNNYEIFFSAGANILYLCGFLKK